MDECRSPSQVRDPDNADRDGRRGTLASGGSFQEFLDCKELRPQVTSQLRTSIQALSPQS